MTVTLAQKREILRGKISMLEQQYFSLQVDYEVAEELENQRMMDDALENMKEIKKRMKLMEIKVEGLGEKQDE